MISKFINGFIYLETQHLQCHSVYTHLLKISHLRARNNTSDSFKVPAEFSSVTSDPHTLADVLETIRIYEIW
jgi:hypothetical protein